MNSLYKEHNWKDFYFFPDNFRYECGTRNINNFTIGPEGEMYKCWNNVGDKTMIIGNISDSSQKNSTIWLRYLAGADPFDDKKCLNCFNLPICNGGCPDKRIKNEYEESKIDFCNIFKGKNLESFLENHYEIKKSNENH